MSQLRTGLEPVVHTAPPGGSGCPSPPPHCGKERESAKTAPALIVAAAIATWIAVFGWLAITRHLAGGSHAEDLGFTDQVIWNFLRGQWFRMSLYQGATWNTELDLSHLARPDSLLAFHVEPMLLAFVPLYALGAGPLVLVGIQAIAGGLGAIPAYRLGEHLARSRWAGVALALAYLLSPLGQWAVLSDVHTSTLAMPLLLLAAERLLVARTPIVGIGAAALALSAREDVGPAVALLGVSLAVLGAPPKWAFAVAILGVVWTVLAAAILFAYGGGASPFGARYAQSLGLGLPAVLAALSRPDDLAAFAGILLSGGWLGLLSPVALLPALPALLANALSSSPWMAAGKAHYSGLLLPFIVLGAAAGLRRIRVRRVASMALVLTSGVAYLVEGAGPLAANYAPATVTEHAQLAARLAEAIPATAGVSASSTLVPRLSHRARLYVFPSVLDAEYIFLDVRATSAPTSPGDVFLHVRDRLASGGWEVEFAIDGLLVLHRNDAAPELSTDDLPTDWLTSSPAAPPHGSMLDGHLQLLGAELAPSSDGAVDVDGPRAVLRTVWRADRALPPGTQLEFVLDLRDGQRVRVWDVAALWWYPPERWRPGEPVSIDISDVPARRFLSWQPVVISP